MLIYLAQPYTGQEEKAYELAKEMSAKILTAGGEVFSPVMAFHPLAKHITQDHSWWMQRCLAMLEKCEGSIFVQIDGWAQSKGMQEEFYYCISHEKPFYKIQPSDIAKAVGLLLNAADHCLLKK